MPAPIAEFLVVHPGFHGEELHLDGYAALRVLEVAQNLDMQLLAAKKPHRADRKDGARDSANDSDLMRDDGAVRQQEELVGGGGEDCDTTDDYIIGGEEEDSGCYAETEGVED